MQDLFAQYVTEPDEANCLTADPDAFFEYNNVTVANVIKICAVCPVLEGCLDYSLAAKEEFGVWGGTTGRGRRHMTPQRKKEHLENMATLAKKLRVEEALNTNKTRRNA
ncbi:Transcription factor WhiB [uncultured Caudovirales phage]|uniref:Transcription factor WhiB n=1 Tax=uncultured Caudovirales phage TaxID=2100421 RepID=A0A6J5L8Y6_9CAUD|nr:Transcription factor WhiB [uncultured Caudovirales phage]